MWIFKWAIVNKMWLIHNYDWSLTSMDTKIGSPTFYTWGLKSVHNINTRFAIIPSNELCSTKK